MEEDKFINSKLKIVTNTNKKGEDYKVLEIYIESKNGELVKIHDLYLRDHLAQIIKFVSDN